MGAVPREIPVTIILGIDVETPDGVDVEIGEPEPEQPPTQSPLAQAFRRFLDALQAAQEARKAQEAEQAEAVAPTLIEPPDFPEPDRDVDTRSEAFLESAGLLPPTKWDGSVNMCSPSPSRPQDPLVYHHERTMRNLADELIDAQETIGRAYDESSRHRRQAGKLHTAVRWLRDNTPQDELSLRVIAYVLDGDD